MKKTITQQYLKSKLTYNPVTGKFRWNKTMGGVPKSRDRWAGHNRADGYIRIKIDGKLYYGHHLAWLYMTGDWPKDDHQIDHKDQNRSNNKFNNLREIHYTENHFNRSKPSTNKSGICGVCWCKSTSKWVAHIGKDNKKYFLGRFTDLADAAKARKDAEKELGFYKNHGK